MLRQLFGADQEEDLEAMRGILREALPEAAKVSQ
jgi:hypothetical protein